MSKRILSLALIFVFLFSLFPIKVYATDGFSNFKVVTDYSPELFTDVPPNEWYAKNVEMAYKYGLISGVSPTSFSPDTNLRISEAIKLAACMHSIYNNGLAEFERGNPWYQVYVDYAKQNGIITSDYKDYSAYVTRAEFARIFANALPDEALAAINTVENNSLPDVMISDDHGPAVYKLYRAGILVGNDAKGTFDPDSFIRRKEAAAIVTRMIDPSLRRSAQFYAASSNNDLVTFSQNPLLITAGRKTEVILTINVSKVLQLTGNSFYVEVKNEDPTIAKCTDKVYIDGEHISLSISTLLTGSTAIHVDLMEHPSNNLLYTIPLQVIVSPDKQALKSDEYFYAVPYDQHDHKLLPGFFISYYIAYDKLKDYTIMSTNTDPSVFTYYETVFPSDDYYYFKAESPGTASYIKEIYDSQTYELKSRVTIPITVSEIVYYPGTSIPDFGYFMDLPAGESKYDDHITVYAYDITDFLSGGLVSSLKSTLCLNTCYPELLNGCGFASYGEVELDDETTASVYSNGKEIVYILYRYSENNERIFMFIIIDKTDA